MVLKKMLSAMWAKKWVKNQQNPSKLFKYLTRFINEIVNMKFVALTTNWFK